MDQDGRKVLIEFLTFDIQDILQRTLDLELDRTNDAHLTHATIRFIDAASTFKRALMDLHK